MDYWDDDLDWDDWDNNWVLAPAPPACSKTAKRAYTDNIKVGDLVTIVNREYPEGRDAMIWDMPETWTDDIVLPFDKGRPPTQYETVNLLVWNEDKTDFDIHRLTYPTESFPFHGGRTHHVGDLGMVRGGRADHYVVFR